MFYPRVIAPKTGAADLEWRVSKGLGTVHATTVVHPQQGEPYNVCLVDVDEGFRMMSRVEDIAPDAGQDRHAGEVPGAYAGGRRGPLPRVHPGGGRVMAGVTRGSVAIVGAAESDLGAVAALMSPIDLMAQGIHRALEDAGLTLADVDGLFCATTQARTSAMSLVEYLGLPNAYTDSTIVGGSSFEVHVAHAHAALEAGLCSVAVVAYGSTQRTVGRRAASAREFNPYETPYKPFLPATAYAMAANRHMHEYGTTREQMAAVAVAAREWALLNPAAWEKKPLTIADVLNARPISDPFTVRDICLVTDGGGAIVLVRADRAASMKQKPVYVLGSGQSITHASITSMPVLTHTGAIESGAQAYRAAGVKAVGGQCAGAV